MKLLKQRSQVLLGYANPTILNGDMHQISRLTLGGRCYRDTDKTVIGKLDRIGEQILHDLPYARRVRLNHLG